LNPGVRRQKERYDPMPGVLSLPGFVYRKLGRRGRRAVLVGGALLLLAAAVTTALLVPVITENKREQAARDRREAALSAAREHRRLVRESRPRMGRLAPAVSPMAFLESRITRDARARVESGELRTPVRRTDCQRLGERHGLTVLGCVAVTSDIKGPATTGGRIGYPYQAAFDPARRRYALCKTSGRPAEGFLTRGREVPVPRACGG
jgi:hypothetical protein